jgi:hypothetical protein
MSQPSRHPFFASGVFFPAAFILLSAALLVSLGCGRSGMPRPADESKNFSWKEVSAKPAGDCVVFEGSFEGAYEHFDGIRLEIAGISGPDDCPGCPFVPGEITELSARDAGFNPADGSLGFSYCPRKAGAYRWRLAGISRYNRLPHATMVDRLLIITDPE